MNLSQVVDSLLSSELASGITAHRRLPAMEAVYAPFPQGTDARLIAVLRDRGISFLYSHQAEALARPYLLPGAVLAGQALGAGR